MREIKFRAWDGEKMLTQTEPILGMTRGDKLVISLYTHDKEQTEETYTHNPNLLLMQFTGLKDKNGKEIYEGDIVKWDGDPDTSNEFYRTPNGIYEVIWKWTGFHFRDWSNCKFTPKSGEIIGNIYENPELLK